MIRPLGVLLIALTAVGFISPASSLDPVFVPDNDGTVGGVVGTYMNNASFRDTSGKKVMPGPYAAPTCVLLSAGQSNEGGEAATAYTPLHADVYNFNPFDGTVYNAADPLLGASTFLPDGEVGYGSFLGRLADGLLDATSCKSVILAPSAIGGSKIADWTTGVLAGRLPAVVNSLLSRGLRPTALLWGQGETDCRSGTTMAAYRASGVALWESVRATGWAGPIFIAQQSWTQGSGCTAITSAQASMVNPAANIWAGPNNDAFGDSYRYDKVHFSDSGNAARALAWQKALHAYGPPF
jgi:Carbohydrate esterase, sialic acid-specific acetylesterase